jgi:hypothetical protein
VSVSSVLLVELLAVDAAVVLTALVEDVLLVLDVEFRAAASVLSKSVPVEIAEMDITPPFLRLRM